MSPAARAYSRRDTVLFVSCLVAAFAAIQLPDRIRDPFAAALRQTIVAPLVALQSNAEQSRRSWLTRELREAQRDSIALRSMSLDASLADNDRLRKLLGLGQALRWGFVPAEVLQGRGVGEEYTVVLSAGSKAGILPFSPVVAPEGLVGMVKSADPTMSIAIVWAHPDFRVSAMAVDGGAFGIVGAHLGGEPERYLLEMRGVPMRSTLKPGTLIVSSGLGGTFPRGIPVGTVMAEMKTSELWARTYLLRPAVAPADVSDVMVLLPARTTAGVQTVWKTGLHADSAVKSIVAAGDSLARLAAKRDSAAAPRDTTQKRDSTAVTAPPVVPSPQREARPAQAPPASRAPTTTTP
ncbi:MAG TPA: rod shape-determining protein MreC [Gemmatimonadaceae bacterium]|nr:rod shape-determining protein MreC [Gemmatimonadaceae bacterium]